MDARILAPVRYSAWLAGDLGRELHDTLRHALDGLPEARVTRLARGFLVEAEEAPGPLLEATACAMRDMEDAVAARYPVFHHEMGPVWTGTLQAVFPPLPARTHRAGAAPPGARHAPAPRAQAVASH